MYVYDGHEFGPWSVQQNTVHPSQHRSPGLQSEQVITAMAFTGRDARFEMSAMSDWDDPAQDEPQVAWVRRAMAIVEPDAEMGRYCNEIGDSGPGETRAIYGDAKLERLSALKRSWDPDNVFHMNHNIAP